MTAAVTDIGTFITSSPNIRNGKPCIAGTGVSVHRISIWYNLGNSPEEIARQLNHLTLAQVYAALTYYLANRAIIDAEVAAEEAEGDRIEREYLAQRNTREALPVSG